MTLFDSFGESSIPDNPGFKHLLLTYALCAPSALWAVFYLLGSVFEGLVGATSLNSVLRVVAMPVLLLFLFHWVFTFGAAVSALALSVRHVPPQRKIAAWVAVAVTVLVSMEIQHLTVW